MSIRVADGGSAVRQLKNACEDGPGRRIAMRLRRLSPLNVRELPVCFLADHEAFLAAETTPVVTSLARGFLKMMGLKEMRYISICIVSLITAGGIAYGKLQDEPTRFEQGLRGNIVEVNLGKPATVTISLEGQETWLNLDVSSSAKVWTAYEIGQLSDLTEGQYVSLRLADDHRTVNEIHIEGEVQIVAIKSLTQTGKITIDAYDDDDEERDKRTEVELAPDAILRIGRLPAVREEFKAGMEVQLEFGRDGKFVHAMTAQSEDHLIIYGVLRKLNADSTEISIEEMGEDDEPSTSRSFKVTSETIVWQDLKPVKLADLKVGDWVVVRLSDDENTVRAIKATSPEPEDDDDEDGEDK